MQSISLFLGIAKFADFRWKNAHASRTQVVCHVIYIFFIYDLYLLWVRCNSAKCHHCRICKKYFREGAHLLTPIPWAALKKRPIVNRVKIAFQTTLCKYNSLTKFRSKFQFRILFYRTADKVTKIKLVMVIVKSFDKYHHFFNLYILVTILFFSWLRFKHT